MRKLSDFKIKNRSMKVLNSFRPNNFFNFRIGYGLSAYSYHVDVYQASDRSDRNDHVLSDVNSGPIRLSKLTTRHTKLRDFIDDYSESFCGRYYYDVTDQASRLLFMLHGGNL